MSKSKIEWTEATWNPSIGCTKVSQGCLNCYAASMAVRLQAMGVSDYRDGFKFKIMPHRLSVPLKTKKPTKFFVNSMSDLFHEEMPQEYLDKVFGVIRKTPHHTYQILTKRSSRMAAYFKGKRVPENVWLGVTVESKSEKYRIDDLRNISTTIKFISAEPLLSDLETIDLNNIDWIIVGGESGSRARRMKQDWVINIKDQAQAQGTAFFFKQWGAWGADGVKRNKKANGRRLLNKTWDEYPVLSAVKQK